MDDLTIEAGDYVSADQSSFVRRASGRLDIIEGDSAWAILELINTDISARRWRR
jgi:hypothetical protein